MISRFASAAARAAGLLIFALTLVTAESGMPIGGVAEAIVAIEYLKCPNGTVPDTIQKRCVPGPKRPAAPTGLRIDVPKPVCRPDQVLIAGKLCGCPAQTRAKQLSPGVFKCLPT